MAAVRALLRVARRFERESSVLALAHYRVLAAVSSGERRASHVAARLALGKPAISSIVDTLWVAGLLDREQSATDRRVVTLRVTRAGATALAEYEAHLRDLVRRIAAHTPDPELTMQVLGWLGPALDQTQTEIQSVGDSAQVAQVPSGTGTGTGTGASAIASPVNGAPADGAAPASTAASSTAPGVAGGALTRAR
jgi:DNA-binding MarR family transcriptional regulator